MPSQPERTAQDWIDRYVQQALRYQPKSEHAAAEVYVRAQIDTALKTTGANDPPSADDAIRALDQLGAPAQVVAGYATPPSLIGPMLFPVFRTVLGIVLLTLTGLYVFGIAFTGNGFDGGRSLLRAISGLTSSYLQAIGMLVIIFAIIEWQTRRQLPTGWKAAKLPPLEDRDRISTGKAIADIAFTLAAIIFFNGFADRIGGVAHIGGEWETFPVFGPGFLAFIPWLTALWVAEILLKTYLITQGRWHTATRVMEIMLSLCGMILLSFMLAAGNLAAQPNFEPLFRLAIGVVLAVATVDVIVQVYRLFK